MAHEMLLKTFQNEVAHYHDLNVVTTTSLDHELEELADKCHMIDFLIGDDSSWPPKTKRRVVVIINKGEMEILKWFTSQSPSTQNASVMILARISLRRILKITDSEPAFGALAVKRQDGTLLELVSPPFSEDRFLIK